MTARAALTHDLVDLYKVRPSARVRTVANLLDCDESQVRRLVAEKKLDAHPFGKRGVRVYLDSVSDYQGRGTKSSKPKENPTSAGRNAHRHAMAELRARGIV